METWLLILGIGIVVPALLIAIAVVRLRKAAAQPPPPAASRSKEQQKALERRQSMGYTQNVERDL